MSVVITKDEKDVRKAIRYLRKHPDRTSEMCVLSFDLDEEGINEALGRRVLEALVGIEYAESFVKACQAGKMPYANLSDILGSVNVYVKMPFEYGLAVLEHVQGQAALVTRW
jgi:hypothetical protein